MITGRSVLGVVPARSGSKGILHKNLWPLGGVSLIGWAARTMAGVNQIDRRILSTDAPGYAEEGRRHGLEVPFLRPPELSTDEAGIVDVLAHALREMEDRAGHPFDIVTIIEPTSPFRFAADIERTLQTLIDDDADSAVTVSPLPAKAHPAKVLRVDGGRVAFYLEAGRKVTHRQILEQLYWRNGVCYALTRTCLLEQRAIIGARCAAVAIDHPVVNIDEPWELEWAEYLLGRGQVVLP